MDGEKWSYLDIPFVQAFTVIRNYLPLHQLDVDTRRESVNRMPFFLLLLDSACLGSIRNPCGCQTSVGPVVRDGGCAFHCAGIRSRYRFEDREKVR